MAGGGLHTLVNLEEFYIGHNAIKTVEGERSQNEPFIRLAQTTPTPPPPDITHKRARMYT